MRHPYHREYGNICFFLSCGFGRKWYSVRQLTVTQSHTHTQADEIEWELYAFMNNSNAFEATELNDLLYHLQMFNFHRNKMFLNEFISNVYILYILYKLTAMRHKYTQTSMMKCSTKANRYTAICWCHLASK